MNDVKNAFLNLTTLLIASVVAILGCNAHANHSEQCANEENPSKTRTLNETRISEVVRMVFQDSQGILWFGTQDGAFKSVNDSLIRIADIRGEHGTNVTIKDITESPDGSVWVAHTDGISRVTHEGVTNYYESHGLINRDVWSIEADADGLIWISTFDGVCTYDGKSFSRFDLPEGEIDSTLGVSSSRMVHSIKQDRSGTMWFCTNAGLFSYADGRLSEVSKKAGIATNFVNDIVETKKDEYMVATKEGLYILKDGKALNINLGQMEMDKGIGAMGFDQDSTLWFVANQHQLFTYNGSRVEEFEKPNDHPGPVIFHIFNDSDGRLWFVGYGGAFRMENGRFISITPEGPW
ncbi:MAG: hypothetical protein RL226_1194 [Bacteroidota bacterium]